MPRMIRVKARPGLSFPIPPHGREISPEGELVDGDDMFWMRRIVDGDVIEVPAEADADEETAAQKPASEEPAAAPAKKSK